MTISLICMLLLLSRYAIAEEKEFNFVAVGDLDCNVNSNQTINNIINKKPELFLALGDMYYDCSQTNSREHFHHYMISYT